MRKEYYNYVVKLPVLLHELFRGKVADYHFSDMTWGLCRPIRERLTLILFRSVKI